MRNMLRVNNLLAVVALVLVCGSLVYANDPEGSDGDAELRELPGYVPGEEETLPFDSSLNLLRKGFMEEVQAHPHLYDSEDIEIFFNSDRGQTASNFLIQRDGDWKKAYRSAVKTLRWRAMNRIAKLDASDFPCDLYSLGFITEHGLTRPVAKSDKIVIPSEPIIWIRLGALGNIVKHLERYSPRKMAATTWNSLEKARSKLLSWTSWRRRQGLVQEHGLRTYQFEDRSLSRNPTIQHALKSIAWWLDNWRSTNTPGAKATLVIDMENTDFAFSSKSVANFFIGLDEKFPNLFDQILLYRYRFKSTSLIHSPVSMINRIFRTRVSSSMATFNKIRIIRHESDINSYMPRVDSNGHSLLPDFVSGDCSGPIYEKPIGCHEDSRQLALQKGMYDGDLWTSIYNKFYQMCKPLH